MKHHAAYTHGFFLIEALLLVTMLALICAVLGEHLHQSFALLPSPVRPALDEANQECSIMSITSIGESIRVCAHVHPHQEIAHVAFIPDR